MTIDSSDDDDELPQFIRVGHSGLQIMRGSPFSQQPLLSDGIINTFLDQADVLEKAYIILQEQSAQRREIQRDISDTFADQDLVSVLAVKLHNSSLGFPGFFLAARQAVQGIVHHSLEQFTLFEKTFKDKIKPLVKTFKAAQKKRNHAPVPLTQEVHTAFKAIQVCAASLFESHVDYRVAVAQKLQGLSALAAAQGEYLQARFVRKEEQASPSPVQFMQFNHPERDPHLPEYIKIKFIDDNPILTDMLLQAADFIPRRHKRRGQKEREVFQYQIDDAAEFFVGFSDKKLLSYVEDSRSYFEHFGKITAGFVEVCASLEEVIETLKKTESTEFTISNAETAAAYEVGEKRVPRIQRRFANTNIPSIVQKEEEYLPDSRLQKEQANAREKLLLRLYDSMKAVAEENDEDKKGEIAQAAVRDAVLLKEDLDELLAPTQRKRLRRDLRAENEFYVGKQGQMGRFYFERAPTPSVTIERVIGKSFDDAKQHVADLIQTATLSTLMRITAPDGKVRQNMLLVGPYGCGKTEFAKAVCGDKRVIGASVRCSAVNTAFVHESAGNVGRVYDAALDLYREGREQKPVSLVLDEFDVWFGGGKETQHHAYDAAEVETMFLEVLDGVQEYDGLFTIAMTNNPAAIPGRILRRFEYAAVVGQLTDDERAGMIETYFTKGMPVADEMKDHYLRWAREMQDAPGNTVRRIADAVHKQTMRLFISEHFTQARRLQTILERRERKKQRIGEGEFSFAKQELRKYFVITPAMVDEVLPCVLAAPHVRKEIKEAREVYHKAGRVLFSNRNEPFGLREREDYFGNRS